jgi:hypothetical protein
MHGLEQHENNQDKEYGSGIRRELSDRHIESKKM